MFINTDKQFLYYHYNKQYYKVPTYGKIWKIIDFGRSIYTINDTILTSDSFFQDEDAYSQYNFGSFYNPKKSSNMSEKASESNPPKSLKPPPEF